MLRLSAMRNECQFVSVRSQRSQRWDWGLTGGNSGLSERYALVGNNPTCHVYGPLNADMCQLNKCILNGVETRITLWPSTSKFNLVKPDTITGDFKIKITDIYLHACKISVAPEIMVAHNAMLAKTPAKYPYDRTRILTLICFTHR